MSDDEKNTYIIEIKLDELNKENSLLEYYKTHETDLVEVTDSSCPCEKCAMYRRRIYSFSGNDKRFPKYPDWLKNNMCTDFCGLMSYPYIEELDHHPYITGDIFEVSNRPFVDDRTPEEKKAYEERREKRLREQMYREEYSKLLEALPEAAPKSLAAYSRMKNRKSKGYIALKEKAKLLGIEI